MKVAECLEDWPEVWPSCPDNLLAWGTGGGVSKKGFVVVLRQLVYHLLFRKAAASSCDNIMSVYFLSMQYSKLHRFHILYTLRGFIFF